MKIKQTLLLLPFLFLLSGCNVNKNYEVVNAEISDNLESSSIDYIDVPVNDIIEEEVITEEVVEEVEPEVYEVELVAVGDNLIHSMVIKSGLQDDGSRNYNYMYEDIKDFINESDIKVINQETVFINDSNKYSGYFYKKNFM